MARPGIEPSQQVNRFLKKISVRSNAESRQVMDGETKGDNNVKMVYCITSDEEIKMLGKLIY